MYIYVHMYMYIYISVCIYYICICICVCIYIYILFLKWLGSIIFALFIGRHASPQFLLFPNTGESLLT